VIAALNAVLICLEHIVGRGVLQAASICWLASAVVDAVEHRVLRRYGIFSVFDSELWVGLSVQGLTFLKFRVYVSWPIGGHWQCKRVTVWVSNMVWLCCLVWCLWGSSVHACSIQIPYLMGGCHWQHYES